MKFDDIEIYGSVFVTSDIHYGQKNICRGVTRWRDENGNIPIEDTRPFETIEEMNDVIVKNINDVVGKGDTLIMLGDICFGGFENIGEFLDRLKCKNIHLVMGNHDHHIRNNRENIRERFLSVTDYLQVNIHGVKMVLSHYPFSSWNGMGKGVVHLHGHVHLPVERKWGNGKKLDVGLDGNFFKPYKLTELIHMMDRRKIQSELEDGYHVKKNVEVFE